MSRERIMLTQAIPAVQQLRRVQGFDPLRFLKRNANGGIELEPRYQRLWFRLAGCGSQTKSPFMRRRYFCPERTTSPLPILPRR